MEEMLSGASSRSEEGEEAASQAGCEDAPTDQYRWSRGARSSPMQDTTWGVSPEDHKKEEKEEEGEGGRMLLSSPAECSAWRDKPADRNL